jgi:hypothetical protein
MDIEYTNLSIQAPPKLTQIGIFGLKINLAKSGNPDQDRWIYFIVSYAA